MSKIYFLLFLLVNTAGAHAQDSVRVLCLYGSVPAKGWQGREPEFKRGMFTRTINMQGGHVGIEVGADSVLSFQPLRYSGPFHAGDLFSHSKHPNSWFRVMTVHRMWTLLGNYYNNIDSLQRAMFVIPVTPQQRHAIDSLSRAYLTHTPYDYAFLGMRCASASYEILVHAGVASWYRRGLWHKIFTTRKFRYAIYKEYLRRRAAGWRLYTWKGSHSRVWDRDKVKLDAAFH
jgi:hypothetical protein